MNLEGIPSSGVKPDTKRQILYESTYMRYLIQSSSSRRRMVVIRGWGQGKGRIRNGYAVSVCKLIKVLEIYCITINIFLILLSYMF